MTRLVPLTLRDGTNFALNAHLVTCLSELPDGLVRIFTNGVDYCDVPGTIADLSTLLSDPPARLVPIDGRYVNPALVAWICADREDIDGNPIGSQIWFSAKGDGDSVSRSDYIEVDCTPDEVAAKLEGRAP